LLRSDLTPRPPVLVLELELVVADTCRVYPVTAKHETKAELGHPWGAKIYSHALRKTKHVSFPEMGLTRLQQPIILKGSDEDDDNVKLPFGLDFTFRSVIENPIHSFTGPRTSFSIVRRDFRIEKRPTHWNRSLARRENIHGRYHWQTQSGGGS
jgi:hypothetical protein